jgi:hypothetical protein
MVKIFKALSILFLILIFSFESHSICDDSIRSSHKFKIHYKFGVSFLYMSPIFNHWNNGNIKSLTNNTYGIALSNDLYFFPKLFMSVSFDYAGNYTKIEYADYQEERFIKEKTSSFSLSIPIRINYSIITLRKIKFTLGLGVNFKNIQELHVYGSMIYKNIASNIDDRNPFKINNYFERKYWYVYESNGIGLEYYFKNNLSLRLMLSFNFSRNERFLFGTNLGIIF